MLIGAAWRALSYVNGSGWKGSFKVVGMSPHSVESEMQLADVKGFSRKRCICVSLGPACHIWRKRPRLVEPSGSNGSPSLTSFGLLSNVIGFFVYSPFVIFCISHSTVFNPTTYNSWRRNKTQFCHVSEIKFARRHCWPCRFENLKSQILKSPVSFFLISVLVSETNR